jgi:hypothetical protein
MKKILQNIYFDYCIKTALGGLLIWFIALQLQVRDFITYKQPAIDDKQITAISMQTDRIDECEATTDEQNSNTNKRIDATQDDVNIMKYQVNQIYNVIIKNNNITSYNQNQ